MEVTQIVRQTGQYRQIMEHLTRGEVAAGCRMMDEANLIQELPLHERYKAIADMYVKETLEGVRPLVVAPAHAEGRLVTEAIREKLKAEDELTGERPIEILKPVHLSPAQKMDYRSYRPGQVVELITDTPGTPAGTRMVVDTIDYETGNVYVQKPESATRTTLRNLDLVEYADHFEVFEPDEVLLGVGDRIRITKNGAAEYGQTIVYNSDQHTVVGFAENGDLKLDNGLVLARDFAHMAYGYYNTSYAAQSMTVQHVIIAESVESFGAASREQFNVSVGRGKFRPDLFTDDKDELLYAVERSSQRHSALDLVRAAEANLTASPNVETLSEDQANELRLAQERADARKLLKAEGIPPVPLKETLGAAPSAVGALAQDHAEKVKQGPKLMEVRQTDATTMHPPAPLKERVGAVSVKTGPLAQHAAKTLKPAPQLAPTPPPAAPSPPLWHWPETLPEPPMEQVANAQTVPTQEPLLEPSLPEEQPRRDDPDDEDLQQRLSLHF